MARGENTANHPNRQVGRKTPRLAELIGRQHSLKFAQVAASRHGAFYPPFMNDATARLASPEYWQIVGQGVVDGYRLFKNKLNDPNAVTKVHPDSSVGTVQIGGSAHQLEDVQRLLDHNTAKINSAIASRKK